MWRGGVIPGDIVDEVAAKAKLAVLYGEKEISNNNLRIAKDVLTRTQGESIIRHKGKMEKNIIDADSQINSYKSELGLGKGIVKIGYDSDLETGKHVTLIGEDGKPFQTTPVRYIGLDKDFLRFFTEEV